MYLKYMIGQRVKFVVGEDIEGVIRAYLVREYDSIHYEVAWFHNGESRSGWFITPELEPVQVKQ